MVSSLSSLDVWRRWLWRRWPPGPEWCVSLLWFGIPHMLQCTVLISIKRQQCNCQRENQSRGWTVFRWYVCLLQEDTCADARTVCSQSQGLGSREPARCSCKAAQLACPLLFSVSLCLLLLHDALLLSCLPSGLQCGCMRSGSIWPEKWSKATPQGSVGAARVGLLPTSLRINLLHYISVSGRGYLPDWHTDEAAAAGLGRLCTGVHR